MLAKIFSPFIKLWNWIKETAWIQPLLIVGIVFGVIFSISPIVSACSNMNSSEDINFYKERRISLENVFNDYSNCKAADLLENILDAESNEGAEKDAAIAKLPAKKFFLMFYSESCEACKTSSGAFEYLNENWGTNYFTTDEQFEMVTIDTLEVVDDKKDDEPGFPELLNNIPEFFETCAGKIRETAYFIKGNINNTYLENFEQTNKDSFPVPTILLIDFTDTTKSGFSQLMFNISGKSSGDGDADKAMTLMDCWNSDGDFKLD